MPIGLVREQFELVTSAEIHFRSYKATCVLRLIAAYWDDIKRCGSSHCVHLVKTHRPTDMHNDLLRSPYDLKIT